MGEFEIEIIRIALDAGFSISTAYGQDSNKLMPISDVKTLVSFANKLFEGIDNFVSPLTEDEIESIITKHLGHHNQCTINYGKKCDCGIIKTAKALYRIQTKRKSK